MKNLASYVVTRILLTIPMLFIMLTLVFVVLRVMPGDPVSSMLGDTPPRRVIEQKKKELGLDRPHRRPVRRVPGRAGAPGPRASR